MIEPHMSSKAETLLGMIVFLGVIGFGSLIVKSLAPSQPVVEQVSAIILGATGLVLIWYTVETKRLRIEAQRQVIEIQQQTEGQLRPYVIVEPIFTEKDTAGKFVARNVGNGTALNIRVWFVRVQYDLKPRHGDHIPENDFLYEEISFPENESVFFGVPPVYFLTVNQCSDPIDIHTNENLGKGLSSSTILYPTDNKSIFMIRIHFENVNGQKYIVEETIRRKTLRVLHSGKLQEDTSGTYIIRIAHDEEPYLTDHGKKEAQNWIQPRYTYLP